MKQGFKPILLEAVLLIAVLGFVPLSIWIDIVLLGNSMGEISFTEFSQEGFLLVSAVLVYRFSQKEKRTKGLFIIMAGMLAVMFIREGDYYLDAIVHGFWKVPALLVMGVTLYYANPYKEKMGEALVDYSKTKSFTYMLLGLLIVLLFSRLFGTGSLWREIMGSDYQHLYKTVIQEGLELLGYGLIFYGAMLQKRVIQESRV